VVPRSLISLGAGVLSARAAARLKGTGKGSRAQDATFSRLIPSLAVGSVWWDAGIEKAMTYESFRKRVSPCTHEMIAPAIERMKKGESDVLWPGTCQIYAVTSGASTGVPRHIPVTEAMLAHFKSTHLDSLFWYTNRVSRTSVFKGRHMSLGGSIALARIVESEPFEAYTGDMDAITALNVPGWAERAFSEPGAEISKIADWQQKIPAIAARAPKVNVTLVAGMPRCVLDLAEALRAGGTAGISEIWPNLECYFHGGVPVGPYQNELREELGPTVNFHEVYLACEAFVAAQDAEPTDGLRLMADAGVFFEFLPMSEYDPARITHLGPKLLPLSGVTAGVDYALFVTTPGGLARYLLGDVVRFLSTDPARLVPMGRTDQRLGTFGENVYEKDLTDALVSLCKRNSWKIVNFHVAPLFNDPTIRTNRARHEWWVELQAGTNLTPTGPIMAPELDAALIRSNRDYAAKRATGILDAPFVRLVMPGVFEQWMRHHGLWGGTHKMPRCRNDRIIADELGGALQFAKD